MGNKVIEIRVSSFTKPYQSQYNSYTWALLIQRSYHTGHFFAKALTSKTAR